MRTCRRNDGNDLAILGAHRNLSHPVRPSDCGLAFIRQAALWPRVNQFTRSGGLRESARRMRPGLESSSEGSAKCGCRFGLVQRVEMKLADIMIGQTLAQVRHHFVPESPQ